MGKSCSEKNGLKKGPWTTEEDEKLVDYIQKHGHGRWRTLPKNAGLRRCGKSCRLRWTNYLRPDIKRGKFSYEEEETIIQLHSVLGNKWSAMAARLPGRTDNEIKNYWNTHIKKRLLRMGIDPVTHKPRLDLLQLYSALTSPLCNSSSSQLHVSSLLGNMNGSILSPDLLNLATTFFSFQGNNNTTQCLSPKNFQENPPQQNQVQAPQSLNETQLEQPTNLEQLSVNELQNFCCQSSLQSPWEANEYNNDPNSQAIINTSFENLPNLMNFSSLLSTPSSSTTALHSSSANNCVNGSNEEERDSYCSNMMMFDYTNGLLDVNGFM